MPVDAHDNFRNQLHASPVPWSVTHGHHWKEIMLSQERDGGEKTHLGNRQNLTEDFRIRTGFQ